MRTALLVIVVILASLTATARADEPERDPLCINGRPRARCTAIALAEIGLRYGTSTEGSENSIVIPASLGILVNQGDRGAWGVTAGVLFMDKVTTTDLNDAEGTAYFVGTLRYRRWLTQHIGLDISAGGGKFGALGEVALEVSDMIALTGGVNMMEVDAGHGVAANVGIRFGAQVIGAAIGLFVPSSSSSGSSK